MNLEQYLLNKIAEEGAEISQAAIKGALHGILDIDPRNGVSNLNHLIDELNDLAGVVEMLRDELSDRSIAMPNLYSEEAKEAKKQKVLKWAQHSVKNGTLVLPVKEGAAS